MLRHVLARPALVGLLRGAPVLLALSPRCGRACKSAALLCGDAPGALRAPAVAVGGYRAALRAYLPRIGCIRAIIVRSLARAASMTTSSGCLRVLALHPIIASYALALLLRGLTLS